MNKFLIAIIGVALFATAAAIPCGDDATERADCVTCNADATIDECIECSPGFGLAAGACAECTGNEVSDGTEACDACATGFANAANSDCTPCTDGCETCTAAGLAATCTVCASGYGRANAQGTCTECTGTQVSDGTKACAACTTGFANADNSDCTPCTDGCKTCTAAGLAETCTVCASGWGRANAQGTCTECTGNEVSDGTEACAECDAGFANADNSGCTPCTEGCKVCSKAGLTVEACDECADGAFYDTKSETSTDAKCATCAKGCKTCDGATLVDCLTCDEDAGYTTVEGAAEDANKCVFGLKMRAAFTLVAAISAALFSLLF